MHKNVNTVSNRLLAEREASEHEAFVNHLHTCCSSIVEVGIVLGAKKVLLVTLLSSLLKGSGPLPYHQFNTTVTN